MIRPRSYTKLIASLTLISLLNVQNVYSMGLRSFVALPLDIDGYVVRFSYEHLTTHDIGIFITSAAYGLTHNQTLLFAIPYTKASSGANNPPESK